MLKRMHCLLFCLMQQFVSIICTEKLLINFARYPKGQRSFMSFLLLQLIIIIIIIIIITIIVVVIILTK